ncbi:hypothetical protein D9V41_00580 [Aeromicrobium phragmitis]|uniref:Uncharacterized protein n=1 Tax=Aeromicrobium phragmitis TaxID=2478914 RepID=A0A3L8PP82_9ACTN|nr:hypothetical protein [Aeromicrobium phragmitis]RLV57187.1 hypothetical protein D9V41_00580 [Aeromicrobium phragmitis]
MIAPTAPLARGLRATAVGFAVTAVAVGAHVVGHGTPPPLLALAPVALAVAALVLVFSGTRWNVLALLAVIGAAQVAVHELSVYLTGHDHISVLMLIAHVVATVGTSLGLAYGERLWWRLWRWATRVLMAFENSVTLPVTRLPRLDLTHRAVPVGCPPRVLPRRGPPAC